MKGLLPSVSVTLSDSFKRSLPFGLNSKLALWVFDGVYALSDHLGALMSWLSDCLHSSITLWVAVVVVLCEQTKFACSDLAMPGVSRIMFSKAVESMRKIRNQIQSANS